MLLSHSSHPLHVARNIPYVKLACSPPKDLQCEMDKIRDMLLFTKHPSGFIDRRIRRFSQDLTDKKAGDIHFRKTHFKHGELVLDVTSNRKENRKINFSTDILLNLTYMPSLPHFGSHFHKMWQEIFHWV
jgi:hypothetical protein